MGAGKNAGANAPAPRSLEVRGIKFTVDEDYIGSWAAFEIMREFRRDDLDAFEKFDLSLRLIEDATGVTKDDIIAAAGGEKAPAADVINTALEITQAIAPKNS